MKSNLSANKKTLEIWLTNSEQQDQSLRDEIEILCKLLKSSGIQPVIYMSGNDPLYDNMLDLLIYEKTERARKNTGSVSISETKTR